MKKDDKKGSDDDLAWKAVTRTVKAYTSPAVKPGGASLRKKATAAPAKTAPARPAVTDRPLHPPAAVKKTPAYDKGTEQQLKKGKLRPEGQIDLHGMTQSEALPALQKFIYRALRDGKRTLRIITGKGRVSAGGVLRRMVPLWLAETELRDHIIAVTIARPEDGGAGALYVRLRKTRD